MDNKNLIKNLKQMKNLEVAGTPQASWLLSSKDILMSQINPQSNEVKAERTSNASYYFQYFTNFLKAGLVKPVAFSAAVLALLVSYNATAGYANSSIDGDLLYPVKAAKERLQLALTFSDRKKVELQMNFIAARADELKTLANRVASAPEKAIQVSNAAKRIAQDTKAVKDQLNKITLAATGDGEMMAVIKNLDTKTLEVSQSLNQIKAVVAASDATGQATADLQQAINNNNEVGAQAITAIVTSYNKEGGANITDTELSNRLSDRLNVAAENLNITNSASSSVVVATSTNEKAINFSLKASENFGTMLVGSTTGKTTGDLSVMITDAKMLVEQKNYDKVLQVIIDSNGVIIETTPSTSTVVSSSTVSTSTKTE
ncbi:MAG: DUF5667 domain-containing protein [bacterium]